MRKTMFVLTFLLLTIPAIAQGDLLPATFSPCQPARVVWTNVIGLMIPGYPKQGPAPSYAKTEHFGCVTKTQDFTIVVTSFVNEKPGDFMAIPNSWIVSVTNLYTPASPDRHR